MNEEHLQKLESYLLANPSVSDEVLAAYAAGVGASPEEAKWVRTHVYTSQSKDQFGNQLADLFDERVEKPVKPENKSSFFMGSLSISQILLVLGLSLIVIAFIVILAGSWSSLANWHKFLVVIVPNIALLLTAFLVKKDAQLAHIQEGSLALGLLLLPLSLGTALFQFHALPVDTLLFLICSITVLPIYIYFDFWEEKQYASFFTIITTAVFVASCLIFFHDSYKGLDVKVFAITSLILGIIFFAVGYFRKNEEPRQQSDIYEVVGTLVLAGAIPFFANTIFEPSSSLKWDASQRGYYEIGVGALGAVLLGYLITVLGRTMKPNRMNEYYLQRILYLTLLATFFTPFVSLMFQDTSFSLLTLVVSLMLAATGVMIGVSLVYYISLMIASLSFVVFIGRTFSSISVPLAIMVIGFLLIGLSVLVVKEGKKWRKLSIDPPILDRIGILPDQRIEEIRQNGSFNRRLIIWIIVGLLFGSPIIIYMIDALSTTQRQDDTYVSTESYPEPSATPDYSQDDSTLPPLVFQNSDGPRKEVTVQEPLPFKFTVQDGWDVYYSNHKSNKDSGSIGISVYESGLNIGSFSIDYYIDSMIPESSRGASSPFSLIKGDETLSKESYPVTILGKEATLYYIGSEMGQGKIDEELGTIFEAKGYQWGINGVVFSDDKVGSKNKDDCVYALKSIIESFQFVN